MIILSNVSGGGIDFIVGLRFCEGLVVVWTGCI